MTIFPAAALGFTRPGWASSQSGPVLHLQQETRVPAECLLDVPVNLENVSNMTAFSLRLTFDPTVVQVVEVRNGDFLQGEVVEPLSGFDNTAGTLRFGMARFLDEGGADLPVNASGELVHMRVLALQPGSDMKMQIDESETNLVEADSNGEISYSIVEDVIYTGSCAAKRVYLPLINR